MAKVKSVMRRYWTAWLLTVCCFFLFVIPHTPVQAVLTKTTAFDTIDAWQALAAATLAVGNSEDISGSFATVVYIEVALTGAAAQAGVDVIIETSMLTGDDWTELTTFKGMAATPNLDDLDEGGGASAGDPTINVTSSTGNYDDNGFLFFVIDTTVAESEVMRVKSEAGNAITLCQDLKYNHVDQEVTTDEVDQWQVSIPFSAAYVRVIINNSDADAGVHWRSHCSKVTALN